MKGINELKQVSIRLIRERSEEYNEPISSPRIATEMMKRYLGDFDREAFVVVCLDTRNKPTNFSVAHIGSIDRSVVHPREVFKTAILSNAAKIMCFHNHPGMSLTPSEPDIAITKVLGDAGKILGIELLDHIIVAGNRCYSIMSDCEIYL